MNRIPLLVPRMPKADRILPYLRQIDDAQWYTNFGPLNRQLEHRLLQDTCPHFSVDNITTVSNCTVGLELALQATGLPVGARVLLPAITFVATATAVLRVGMTPVLSDVDPDTWVLTPKLAARALSEKGVDAIMPVSTFGYAHDPGQWDAFVEQTRLPVIIDAAGAYGNQLPGRLTDVVFSFHATKSFGAAEGGAVLSADPGRIAMVRRLANFGIDPNSGRLAEVGTNGKMSEYHCAIGLASFDEWDVTKDARRGLYARYRERLQHMCPHLGYQSKDPDGIYPLMPVAIPRGINIETVREALSARGIETRRWYSPSLHTHPALSGFPRADDLHVAMDLGERILGLPFFMGLDAEQMGHVCESLSTVLAEQLEKVA